MAESKLKDKEFLSLKAEGTFVLHHFHGKTMDMVSFFTAPHFSMVWCGTISLR